MSELERTATMTQARLDQLWSQCKSFEKDMSDFANGTFTPESLNAAQMACCLVCAEIAMRNAHIAIANLNGKGEK